MVQQENTREALLETAVVLLAENTGHEITHRVIAGRAGVNHALVNYHFGSREGLYSAVLERCQQEWDAIMHPIYEEALEGLDGVADDRELAARTATFIDRVLIALSTPEIAKVFRVFKNTDLVTEDLYKSWFVPQILSPFHDAATRLAAKALGGTPGDLHIMIQGQLIVAQCMTGINARYIIAPKAGISKVSSHDLELFRKVTIHSVLSGLHLPLGR
jgi:AcrR family transcriptional regulator